MLDYGAARESRKGRQKYEGRRMPFDRLRVKRQKGGKGQRFRGSKGQRGKGSEVQRDRGAKVQRDRGTEGRK